MPDNTISNLNRFCNPRNLLLDTRVNVLTYVKHEICASVVEHDLDFLFKVIYLKMQHGFISIINSFYDPQNLSLDTTIIVLSHVEQEIYAIIKIVTLTFFSRSFTPFRM